MKKSNKFSLLSDLIILSKADGKVTHSEYDFLIRLAERMDISKEELDFIFNNPLPSQTVFTELERITHFNKLLLLMNVDHETHKKEVIMLRKFGLSMGIREDVIQQVLDQMEHYDNKIIPPEKLIKIFKTFYN